MQRGKRYGFLGNIDHWIQFGTGPCGCEYHERVFAMETGSPHCGDGGAAGSYVSGRSAAGAGSGASHRTCNSLRPSPGRPGGLQRSTVDVQGYLLEGARAVWFEQGSIQGRVRDVRAVSAEGNSDSEGAGEDEPVLQGVRVKLEIPSDALAGVHRFRLVSKLGVSNALMFRVNSDAVLDETSQPHQTPSMAQQVACPGGRQRPGGRRR